VIVYGDPQYQISSRDLEPGVREYFRRAENWSLDSARDLLIAVGQVEQAIADATLDSSDIERATDSIASYFLSVYRGQTPDPALLRTAWRALETALAEPFNLRIKVPEGFAFYSLYPEQYCNAAAEWMRARTADSVLVVGIRSIGTTVSAVVKASLAAGGWNARRITVRPIGHPFERRVELPRDCILARAIIVDEGPGLSGSSMAAVALALKEAGVADITFFPGHANPPGAAASAAVRKIWAETPSIVLPIIGADWKRSSVVQILHEQTEKILNAPVAGSFDLSAGKWRDMLSCDEVPATPVLERTKFLIRASNGRSLLWKFAGLGPGQNFESLTQRAFARQRSLSESGWCSLTLAESCGFIATEWQNSRCFTAEDLTDDVIDVLSRYICESAQPPLPLAESRAALDRLRTLCAVNFSECGLKEIAASAENAFAEMSESTLAELPTAGDGRMAPHEWLRHENRMQKTDVWGHEFDHTFPGPKPFLWDIAGAIVEWRMSPAQADRMVKNIQSLGQYIPPTFLNAYLLAYCAFRIGLSSLAGDARSVERYSRCAADWALVSGGKCFAQGY
jgi:hypothetical protein